MNDDTNMREKDMRDNEMRDRNQTGTRRRAETGEIGGGRMEERDDTMEDVDETEHSRSRTGAGE